MNVSDYKLIRAENTICPNQEEDQIHRVYLMTNCKTSSNLPAFYMCRDCDYIGEVGVGRVLIKNQRRKK